MSIANAAILPPTNESRASVLVLYGRFLNNTYSQVLYRAILYCGLLLLLAGIAGCRSLPPESRENLCAIYQQKPGWYRDSLDAAKRWNGPIAVPMAIMAQESSFRARAKPPMRFFLGFIPYGRASDAYGYPQALDSTWAAYRKEAGGLLSQRDDFGDAIDFIQWYLHKTWKVNRVPKTDAYNQYLNYHEGQGGFRRGSYRNKKWLINTARRVQARAETYQRQLAGCKARLDKNVRRWRLF